MSDRPRKDRQGNIRTLRIGYENDARRMAPGIREANDRRGTHWVEGNGWAPVGWEPWDYEQQQGYRRLHVGAHEYAWAEEDYRDRTDEAWVIEWSLEELGIEMPVYHEEMEDWEVHAPVLGRHLSRDWDFEGPSRPNPVLTPTDLRNLRTDPPALNWSEERKAEAKRQRKEDEKAERLTKVNEERRNIRAMQRAARDAVLAKVESGFEGRAEVHVRKGNQTLRWTYRVEDGVAYIDRKVGGWVTLSERR